MFVPDSKTYKFLDFVLTPHQGLFRGREFIALPPKVHAVLCALVARQGAVVSKDRLIAEVWPEDSASDESLSRCIYVLRRTLGSNGDQSFIQTLHRRGYRFAVPVSVSEGGTTSTETPTESKLQAMEHCRLGFSRLGFCSQGDMEQATLCFEKALELDSDCALAYAGLGEAVIVQAGHGWISMAHAREMLRGMADVGASVAPDSPDVSALSSMVAAMFEWDWKRAELDAEKAIRSGGGYNALLARGTVALCLNRREAAVKDFEAAVADAPYVPHCRSMLTWGLFSHGDIDRALKHARDSIRLLPSVSSVFQDYAILASYVGKHDDAVKAAQRRAQLSDRDPHSLIALAETLFLAGRQAEACDLYMKILKSAAEGRLVWSYAAPTALLIEGPDRCLDVLEAAVENRSCILPIKLSDPRLRTLHDQPRFQKVLDAVFGDHASGSPRHE
jgi:DNA-binding winged helix-turn-helix (wHTH) protein